MKCDAACKSNRKNHWSHVAVDIVFRFPKLAIKLHLASISPIGMDAFQCRRAQRTEIAVLNGAHSVDAERAASIIATKLGRHLCACLERRP